MPSNRKARKSNLVNPNGKSMEYFPEKADLTPLTPEGLNSSYKRFKGMSSHFEEFYNLITGGKLLTSVLQTTSNLSFIDKGLGDVIENANFRNTIAGIFHASHTNFERMALYLPWVSIFIEHFTRIPIPENIKAIEEARTSLGTLADILTNDKTFYDKIGQGVKVANINNISASYDGLEIVVVGNDEVIQPKMISADSSVIKVGGKMYYNGLPGDRAKYPTFLLPEGAQLKVRLKNTTDDKVYQVVPFINGIPFQIDTLGLWYGGFESSKLPISKIQPALIYLSPKEGITLPFFYCKQVEIYEKEGNDVILNISSDMSILSQLSAFGGRLFDEKLSPDERAILNNGSYDEHFLGQILYESRMSYIREFINSLNQPKKTEIYIRKPVIAGKRDSSQLDNPFLGSIGVVLIEVSDPPVEAIDTYSYIDVIERQKTPVLRDHPPKFDIGVAGAAQIGGGDDRAAKTSQSYPNFSHWNKIHRVVGYIPLNLMSAANYINLVK